MSIKQKLKSSVLYKPYRLIYEYFRKLYYRFLPVEYVINKVYYKRFKKRINWDNPQDINEKINWLKLNSDTTEWSRLADKYAVREFVKSKGLEDILVKLYGRWENVDDINFDLLPDSFVLKTNHGWGDVIVVKDKKTANLEEIKSALKKNLKHIHGYTTGEPHYLKIEPCVIAEQMLVQDDLDFCKSLVDYKIWCFNGKPYFIWACYNRTKEHVYVETHDLKWGFHPENSVFNEIYRDGKGKLPCPENIGRMLEIASILSEGQPVVRVDLFNIAGKIYFGEMTFTSDGGYNNFFTNEFLLELGTLVNLDKKSNG